MYFDFSYFVDIFDKTKLIYHFYNLQEEEQKKSDAKI